MSIESLIESVNEYPHEPHYTEADIERTLDRLRDPRHQLTLTERSTAAYMLEHLEDKPCDHYWTDPSNEVIEANGHVVCIKCGALKEDKPNNYSNGLPENWREEKP